MDNRFFENPILNSPYAYPTRHWDLDADGQPTLSAIRLEVSADLVELLA